MELSASKGELDKSSLAHSSRLIIAHVDNISKEEEDMSLNLRKGLKDLLAGRSKGSSSKKAPKTQLPPNLPPPLPPSPFDLLPNPNLQRKKRKEKETEEGEIALPKDLKQQKITKDKTWESLVESREAKHSANVRHSTWNPRLELDGAALPWNSFISEFQKGRAHHMAEALKRPFLLPKDMDARVFPIPEEGPGLSKPLGSLHLFSFLLFYLFLTYSFVVYVQAIQEDFVAEE